MDLFEDFSNAEGRTSRWAKLWWCIAQNMDQPSNTRSGWQSIYGAPLRAGGKVLGSKFLRKEIETLGQKNLILFTCGFSNPTRATNRRIIQDRLIKTLTDEVLTHIKVFHRQGAIDYRDLSIIHILSLMRRKRAIARQDPSERTAEDQQLLETYRKVVSFMDRQAVRPIVDYVWRVNKSSLNSTTDR